MLLHLSWLVLVVECWQPSAVSKHQLRYECAVLRPCHVGTGAGACLTAYQLHHYSGVFACLARWYKHATEGIYFLCGRV